MSYIHGYLQNHVSDYFLTSVLYQPLKPTRNTFDLNTRKWPITAIIVLLLSLVPMDSFHDLRLHPPIVESTSRFVPNDPNGNMSNFVDCYM